jgi:hypothetical protein
MPTVAGSRNHLSIIGISIVAKRGVIGVGLRRNDSEIAPKA